MKLTWDACLDVIKKGSPQGLTNSQIAALMNIPEKANRITHLTLIMWEAGVIQRDGEKQHQRLKRDPIRYFVARERT